MAEATIRSVLAEFWREKLKPWVDLRAYFRQRRIILSSPQLGFGPDLLAPPTWKSPLEFAVQGTLVIAFALGLVSTIGGLVISERPTTVLRVERVGTTEAFVVPTSVPGGSAWSARQKRIQADLESTQQEYLLIKELPAGAMVFRPVPYSDVENQTIFLLSAGMAMTEVPKDEALKLYEEELRSLSSQLRNAQLGPHLESIGKWLTRLSVPLAILFSSYLFSALIQFRGPPALSLSPMNCYLYWITARLFVVNLAFNILLTVLELASKYFPPSFGAIVGDLDDALRSIDGVAPTISARDILELFGALTMLVLVLWWYLVVRRVARELVPVLGLRPQRHVWHQYSGAAKVRKDIILSTVVTGVGMTILVIIISNAYAWIRLGLEAYKL